jgi:hypothetical protein
LPEKLEVYTTLKRNINIKRQNLNPTDFDLIINSEEQSMCDEFLNDFINVPFLLDHHIICASNEKKLIDRACELAR